MTEREAAARPPSRARRQKVERETRRALEKASVRGVRVLVGLSGGADSTALLLALLEAARDYALQVEAAHLNHALRRSADADEHAVVAFCALHEIPSWTATEDTRGYARREHCSIEEAGRQLRYAFLARTARERECNVVALGHTLDDQVETVLMHLIRGAGLQGLRGMSVEDRWPFPGEGLPRVIRPLLAVHRAETAAYCQAHGASPREDETNFDLRFFRNRVRMELVPLLERYNPRIRQAVVALAEAARADTGQLDCQTQTIARAIVAPGVGRASLRRDVAKEMPAALLTRVLARAASLAGVEPLGRRQVEALSGVVGDPRSGLEIALPGGYQARTEGPWLRFERAAEPETPPDVATLPVPGSALFGGWKITAAIAERRPVVRARTSIAFPGSVAVKGLLVRGRRPGDRIRPAGLDGRRKLQDVFVDAGVPRHERDAWPVVCDGEGEPLWLPELVKAGAGASQPDETWILLTATRRSPELSRPGG